MRTVLQRHEQVQVTMTSCGPEQAEVGCWTEGWQSQGVERCRRLPAAACSWWTPSEGT